MKSFVQGSEVTAARRDQYQLHIFSFTGTNVVQSKCVTPICFVTGIFSVFLNCYCPGNTNSISKLWDNLPATGFTERDILLPTRLLRCKIMQYRVWWRLSSSLLKRLNPSGLSSASIKKGDIPAFRKHSDLSGHTRRRWVRGQHFLFQRFVSTAETVGATWFEHATSWSQNSYVYPIANTKLP